MIHAHTADYLVQSDYTAPVCSRNPEPRARGGITLVAHCLCGHQQRTNANGAWREVSDWFYMPRSWIVGPVATVRVNQRGMRLIRRAMAEHGDTNANDPATLIQVSSVYARSAEVALSNGHAPQFVIPEFARHNTGGSRVVMMAGTWFDYVRGDPS